MHWPNARTEEFVGVWIPGPSRKKMAALLPTLMLFTSISSVIALGMVIRYFAFGGSMLVFISAST